MITALIKDFLLNIDIQSWEMLWMRLGDQYTFQCVNGVDKSLINGLSLSPIPGELP